MRRDELKNLLIEVGLDLLIEEGLARGTERLTFKRVFDRAADERGVRVSNASVIGRIWVDMADYQADVLAAALRHDDQEGLEDTILAATQVVATADLTSAAGRRTAAVEVIRVAAEAHIDALVRSRKADINLGLRGLAASRLPAEDGTVAAASIRRSYEEFASRWDFVFTKAFAVLGIRMRPGFSVRQLSMLAVSLTEGFTVWDRVDPAMTRGILRPTGPGGAKEEWTLFSIGLEGLVWQFAELEDGSAPVDSPGDSESASGYPE